MAKPTFYVTTPIYYPSATLHIGHCYTTVAADTLTRYKKMRGYDAYFLTGSDEHGQKIERAAAAAGMEPIQYVDRIIASFQELWKKFDIDYSDFIRTTEPRHEEVVCDVFNKLKEKGDIYLGSYEGHYCVSCETFFTETQIKEAEGVCPDCGGTGKIITEKCADCKGKGYIRKEAEITFNVPAGVNNGSYIRKRGGGHAVQGGVPGDLIIVFKVEPHKLFVRDNFDLKIDVPVSFKTAALGGVVKVPGVDDTFDFTVPEGTQSGQIFTVRGKGIKSATGATGNLIIRVIVEVPSHLTREQKRVLEETDAAIDLKQYDKRKKYADVVESLYGTKPY